MQNCKRSLHHQRNSMNTLFPEAYIMYSKEVSTKRAVGCHETFLLQQGCRQVAHPEPLHADFEIQKGPNCFQTGGSLETMMSMYMKIIENGIQKTLSPPAMAVGFARPFCSIPGASSAIDANLKPTSTKMLLEIVLDGIFVLYVYGYGMLYPWNRFSLQKFMWDLWIHTPTHTQKKKK